MALGTDAAAGYLVPPAPNLYLDGEDTGRASNGQMVVLQRVRIIYPPVLTAFTTTVTAAGDTDILAPAAGHRLRVQWVSAVSDPSASTAPLITVKFGAAGTGYELYRQYAISHRETFDGATDQHLFVNLSQAGTVPVTVHYQQL
jgi:hypothetical protein